jgi:hypothetical protein
MAINQATIAKFDRLVARCHKAGIKQATAKKKELMKVPTSIVDTRSKSVYTMFGFPFGFVNLELMGGRTGFAQYLKGKSALGYNNSIRIHGLELPGLREFGALAQSMELQEAYWEAWSVILESKDIKTYISSRID